MSEQHNTVWAVTAGEYSDYHVLAIFEREEDATAVTLAGLGDDARELDYYRAGEQPVRITKAIYSCLLARGTADYVEVIGLGLGQGNVLQKIDGPDLKSYRTMQEFAHPRPGPSPNGWMRIWTNRSRPGRPR